MKKIVLIFAIILLTFSIAHAQWVIDEGFEGTWPPADWTIMSSSNASNAIVQSSDQAYSGTYSARFSSFFSGAPYDEYLITPEVLSIAGDQASFWYRGYSSGTESFCVGWSSTGTDVNTDFTWGPDISNASTTWQQYVKTDLPVGTKYVAIHYYSDYMYYLYVDDFKVGQPLPWQTDQYGWEDGVATVLGSYGGDVTFENSTEQAYEGTQSLKYTENYAEAPQAFIWWVTGLEDGVTIDASFWIYDDTDQASYPKGRIWAHYTSDPDSIDSYAGSAGGNNDYSTIGWSQLSHSWVFDSDGGTRDGFVVETRLYSNDETNNVIFVDNAEITVGSSTALIHHPTPPTHDIVVEVTVDTWASEASWNVWNYANSTWYFAADQTFSYGGQTVTETLGLPLGDYAVYCWDSYGDGGIAGTIWNEGILLNEWPSTDYTYEGIYDFPVFEISYGNLAGYVMDTSTRAPIMDALVSCGYYSTLSGSDGYYQIDDILVSSIVGPYTVTCEADGFNTGTVSDVIIEVDLTTDLDVVLTAPTMDIDTTPISVLMLPNTTNDDNSITIENNGDGPLNWSAITIQPGKQIVSIPTANNNISRGPYEDSAEEVPTGLRPPYGQNQPDYSLMRGTIGYGFQAIGTAEVMWLDTDFPDEYTTIFQPSWASYAGAYGNDNETHMYFDDNTTFNLIYVDMATGDVTTIGPTGLGDFMNDMSCDKTTGTMYGLYNNTIYTVDLSTGACTVVGPIGNTGGLMIGIAVDGNGDMWGHDLGFDEIWHIDKSTGAGTSVGPTGFDANYAQGMAWDPVTDVVYLAAFNGSNFYYELRTVDRVTGATGLLGGIYSKEVTVLGFPGRPDSWLTIDPTSGTIPAGGSEDVQLTFDSNGILPGESLYGDIAFFSDPDVGTVDVPAEMTVYIPEGYVYEGFDDPSFPPFGWENVDGWHRFTNDPYSGDGYARTSWYHKEDAILVTPRLELGTEDFISFYWINANLYDSKGQKIEGGDTLYVEVSNTYNNQYPVWETLAALSAEEEMTEYENVLVSIPAEYSGNSAKLRFRHLSLLNGQSRGIGLDNIIMPPPYLPIYFTVEPEYQSDYDSQLATVDYEIEINNEGIQADRYYMSVLESRTTKDVLLSEGFESAVPPAGWTQEFVSGTVDWIQSPEGHSGNPPAAYEGTYLALFYNGSYDGFTTKLVTPEIAFGDSKDGELTFWHAQVSWAGDQDELNVYYKDSPSGAWTLLESYTTDVATWTQRTISLPNTSSTYYIAFEGIANYGYGVCIDDVQVTGSGGPGPGPDTWPVVITPDFLDIDAGESATFIVSVTIPETATLDEENTTTIYVSSREDPNVNTTADVKTTAHAKDPYEPNNVIVDATAWAYGEITEGAQIYYNPDYADKDIDIYEFSGLAGDIILCDFILPPDETEFDGAIKLVDADSTEIAFVDEWAGGGSEQLKYRLLVDGDYFLVLGKWDNILDGPSKKDPGRGVNTCYYAMSLELIPSPDIAVSPDSLQLGIIASKETASVDMFIENTGVTGSEDLTYNIEVVIPGVETLLDEGFEGTWPPADWTIVQPAGSPTNDITQSSSYAYSGTYSARFSSMSYSSPYDEYLITPEVNTPDGSVFSFWYKKYTSGTEVFKVGWSSTGTDVSTDFTWGPEISDASTTWQQYVKADLPVGTKYIALHYYSDYMYYLYVDDFNLGTGTPWCSVEPIAGSVEQGVIEACVVTCDETGLTEPGIYTADIIIHNDALLNGASDVTIPLTFFYLEAAQGLQGTVTFALTGEPLDSVKVSAGNFVTYTDEYGFYEFTNIAAGIYDVVFEKDGFTTHTANGIYLSPDWVVLLDVELLFDGAVPENLSATGVQEAIDLDWDKPQTGGGGGGTEYEIVYDDGVAENATAWYDPGNMNAVRFTPDGYPCTIISADVNVYDGSWPVGSLLQPFEVAVFDDDGTGALPGTELGRVTVTPTHFNFIEVDLSSLGITIDNGDFYIAHIQGGSYPDCLPTAIDETVPTVNRSYSRYVTGAEDWAVSDYQDFMIRATVNGPRGNYDLKNKIVTFPSNGMTKEMFVNGSSPRTLEHYVDPRTGNALVGNGITRDIFLLGYNVYEETKGFVAYVEGENNTEYIDDIVAVGTEYTYWATAVYDAGESSPSNTDTAVPLAPGGGYHETFDQNWSTTGWTTVGSPNNWGWSAGWAVLNWSPSAVNYDMSLISPEIDLPPDPLDVYDLTVSMYVNNYSSNDGEVFEIWLIHDTGEDLLWSYDDPTADWGVTGGTDWVFTDTAQYAGQTVQVKFRSHGGTTFNFNYWYVYDVLFDYASVPPNYGALAGTVTDGDDIPVEGVKVTANPADYNPVYTNDLGYYLIDPMAVGLYDVQYYKAGYSEIWYYEVEIDSGVTTVLDVVLGNPTMDITPTSIPDAIVPVGGTSTRTITVTNNGNAPLDWDASIENLTDTNYSINYDLQANPPTPDNSEMTPFGSGIYEGGNVPEDTWDILYNFNATAAGQPGIETNNQHIFTCDWRAGYTGFYKCDMDGTFIESFDIAGATCIRDMAYDGTYFYGSPASTTIYIMDLENQALIGTISASCAGVTGIRHIAYDPELDSGNGGFWIGNWGELGAITMTGSQIYGNIAGIASSVYGSAYDQYTDGGPYLWLFAQPASNAVIQQFNIATQSLTGVTHDCSDIPGFNAGIAGGAATYVTPEGVFALLVNIQQDPNLIAAYELCEATPPWITIDPDAGTVAPYGAYEDVTVTFDAGDDPAGTIHTCDITFASAQGVPSVTVPVTLMVGNPEYGDLTGTVTAATGGALIADAMITASNDADNTYVTYTNSLGVYTIEDMMVGYYTVECTADGYNYHVVPNVPIVVDQTTTQDFALFAPIMVVDPTSLNVNVPPGSTSTSYITINNNGDGPMDFDVTLFDYAKAYTDYSNCTVGGTVISQNGVATGPGNSNGFQADGTRDRDVILHYDGANFDAIGLTSGGTFMVAARFTSDELGIYYDTYEITGVELYINDLGSALTLKIWEGGSFGIPGSEVYSQDVFGSIVAESWNILDLTTNVPLLAGNEYWVGYETTHITGEYTAGCDAGPAVDGKGDWIYLAPGPWDQLHIIAPTLNYNWNIRMVIDFGTAPWIIVEPLFGTIAPGGSMDLAVIFDATDLTQGEIKTADIEIVPTPDVGTVIVPVTLTATDTVSSGDTPVTETKLYANFPNPMFNTTTFRFSLKDRSHVRLSIYNIKGQLVETLLNNELDPSASHTVEWDGTANGKQLANGIYFYKLETNSKTFLNKMILMK